MFLWEDELPVFLTKQHCYPRNPPVAMSASDFIQQPMNDENVFKDKPMKLKSLLG